MSEEAPVAPRMRPVVWRILLGSLLAGIAVGLVVALLLVLLVPSDSYLPGGGWDLAPAAVIVFGAMGLPPALLALLALAIAQWSPRRELRERRAVTIGAVVGALVSPLVFYVVPLAGFAVAAVIAVAAIASYRATVTRAWRRSTEPAAQHGRPEGTHRLR
jgi:uncharacterized BrkB/YihY/UPF0761 family membrane protein